MCRTQDPRPSWAWAWGSGSERQRQQPAGVGGCVGGARQSFHTALINLQSDCYYARAPLTIFTWCSPGGCLAGARGHGRRGWGGW